MSQVIPHKKIKYYHSRQTSQFLTDEQYRLLYRFNRENVKWLAGHFLPKSSENRGGALNTVQRMETTLRYLSNARFQSGVAQERVYIKVQCANQFGQQFSVLRKTVDNLMGLFPVWCKSHFFLIRLIFLVFDCRNLTFL